MVFSQDYLRLSMVFKRLALIALLLVYSSLFAETNEAKISEESLGRDFGVLVGDRIEHRYIIEVPAEFSMSAPSLPAVGAINYWLKLVSVNYQQIALKNKVKKYQLDLVFQTFYAPLDVRVLATPEIKIGFHSADKTLKINLSEWQFSMSPLKETVPVSSKKGEHRRAFMKPDIITLIIDTHRSKLQVYLFGLAALIMIFIWLMLTGRVVDFTRSPFQLAARQVKKLQRKHHPNALNEALQVVHQAFNIVAKQALFSHKIDRFIYFFPEFGSNKQKIDDFYALSIDVFYGEQEAKIEHFEQLLTLCHSLVKVERLALKK